MLSSGPSTVTTYTMATRSSLELMLEKIQQMEDQPEDSPPALPTRPVAKARLPRSRRQLLLNFERSDCEDNGNGDMDSGFEGGMRRSKRTKGCDNGQFLYQQESGEKIGFGEPSLVGKPANESIEGYGCRTNVYDIVEEVINFDDRDDIALEEKLGVQRHIHDHQICCNCYEMKRGVIALQSFIRGENARKYYLKNMTAISVIQKHIKEHFRSRMLHEQHKAVICLQTRIRGWLALRHFNSTDEKEAQPNENTRIFGNLKVGDSEKQVPCSVLVDLRTRVLKTEALLEKKKEENVSLQLKIKQLERRRQQYEENMKSREKMWQDELRSMQISLASAKTSSASRNTKGKLGQLIALSENHDPTAYDVLPANETTVVGRSNSSDHHDQQNVLLDNNAGILIPIKPGQVASTMNSEEEFQKLKLKFNAWKKDFKKRLTEAKTTIKKLGNTEIAKSQRKWWGK